MSKKNEDPHKVARETAYMLGFHNGKVAAERECKEKLRICKSEAYEEGFDAARKEVAHALGVKFIEVDE